MGELLDSSEEKAVSVAAFQAHVRSYLQALDGDVAIWEVGNEVNGNWTGPYASGRGEADARPTKTSPPPVASARSRCTPTTSAPTTAATAKPSSRRCSSANATCRAPWRQGLDYVLLSYYPTQCGGHEPSAAGSGRLSGTAARAVPERRARLRRGGPAQASQQAHARPGAADHAVGLLAGARASPTTSAATSGGTPPRTCSDRTRCSRGRSMKPSKRRRMCCSRPRPHCS